MIKIDKMDRTVSLLDKTGIWITVSDKAFAMHGIMVIHEVQANREKILYLGKWDYLLHHWAREP